MRKVLLKAIFVPLLIGLLTYNSITWGEGSHEAWRLIANFAMSFVIGFLVM